MPPNSAVMAGLPRNTAVLEVYKLAPGSFGRSRSTTMWSRPKASASSLLPASTAALPLTCQ